MTKQISDDNFVREAIEAFGREIGVTGIEVEKHLAGNREFLKFKVGRECPLYTHALFEAQKCLSSDNPFRGTLGLVLSKPDNFPASTEASALLTLLTRSIREISRSDSPSKSYSVPFVPFQKQEDHQLAQPAAHIVRGRRGVGKSTLIRRAIELLSKTSAGICVLDMQSYSTLSGNELIHEVLHDVCSSVGNFFHSKATHPLSLEAADELLATAAHLLDNKISTTRAPILINRSLKKLTSMTKSDVFVFLDDFHLIDRDSQPTLLHAIHASLKGANGWIKVAGLSSLLNVYSPQTCMGLQVPGDAQFIELDLTLANPESAETHLRAIMEGFFIAVGYPQSRIIMPDAAFQRLAWANAGVPRDFLQMFGRSLEHSQRNKHSAITLSDVNIAIGEFGQQKMDDVQRDARNEAGQLREMLERLEKLCLDENRVNAFMVRSEQSKEKTLVQILSDLRMVHLINQSITPRKAGERYEAFILDYSLFTGFRRRPNVREMVPKNLQFKAAELRVLPKVAAGFLDSGLVSVDKK